MYSSHLFLISSASVRSIRFLSFIVPIFAQKVCLVSLIFLKRSLAFPILLVFSISLHWSLKKAFLSLLALLWNSVFRWVYVSFFLCLSFLFFSQLFVRTPQTAIFPFCISSSWGWMALISTSCTMLWTTVHISSGTLCFRSNPLNLSLLLCNHKGFDLGHTWVV